MIREEVVRQHIGVAVNVVTTDPHISSNTQHTGIRRRVSKRSTIVSGGIDVVDPGELAPAAVDTLKVCKPGFIRVVQVVG